MSFALVNDTSRGVMARKVPVVQFGAEKEPGIPASPQKQTMDFVHQQNQATHHSTPMFEETSSTPMCAPNREALPASTPDSSCVRAGVTF